MAEKKPMMLFTGTHESVSAAVADLDAAARRGCHDRRNHQ